MLAMLLLAALIEPQTGVVAAPATVQARSASVDFKVVIAAPVYQPNGDVSVETATLANAAPSLMYVYSRRSICETAAPGAAEPTDAGYGWRLATTTVNRSTTEMVVSVDWRRMWDRGQRLANGPSGNVQLTLHPGDRIPLDHIPNTRVSDACRAVGMGLEVRLGHAAPVSPSGPGNTVLPLGAVEGGGKLLDAELWLLHTLPTGTEQSQHQTVRLSPVGGSFSFTPVKFATTEGEIGVEFTGVIQRYRSPTGEFLLVSMSRVITGGKAPPGGLGGAAPGSLIALPGPADVVSFEMPGDAARRGGGGAGGFVAGAARAAGGVAGAAAGAGGGGRGGPSGAAAGAAGAMIRTPSAASAIAQALSLLDGHGFSIRVRVTPVPGS